MNTPSKDCQLAAPETSKFIPLSEPCLNGREWEYVKECLDTGWVSTAGKFVDQFEQRVAETAQALRAVATVNGSSALHVALLAAGVQPGDEVLCSTLTFIASANAIKYAGANPVFIDAEPTHWQIDPQLIEDFIAQHCDVRHGRLRNRMTRRTIRAIMPVHILGHPVDLDPILAIARRYGLAVVEDAAEALGSRYKNKPIGAAGDVACFSFNGNKTVTSGGGGMVVTNNDEIADRVRHLTTQAKDPGEDYVHGEVGFNYRMPNILAAVGMAQLEQLENFVTAKRKIAKNYQDALPMLDWHPEAAEAHSTNWLSTAIVDPVRTGTTASMLRDKLSQRSIQTRRLWQTMHASKAHRDCCSMLSGVADRITENALSFPSSAHLTQDQQETVVSAVQQAFTEASQQRRAA